MIRYAIIENGAVANMSVADEEWSAPEGIVAIASDTAEKGHLYANGEFTAPPPIPVTREQVDAERDRRTVDEFRFHGKPYRLDEKSISRITAMGADARFAVLGGAQEGNIRWADPDTDFGFIASDNSITPMDAQTVVAFSNAAKLWVSRHTFAGLTLKSMTPIPVDFADDSYWPAAE